MSEDRAYKTIHPLLRIHLVAMGAAAVAPIAAVWNVVASSDLFSASFSSNAFVNWALRAAALLGYQTLMYYLIALIPAAIFLLIKMVVRYAANRPYPDRDRAPQLAALGVGGGCVFWVLTWGKVSLSKKFWTAGAPLAQIGLNYVIYAVAAFFAAWLLFRWLFPRIRNEKRRRLFRCGIGLLALSLIFSVVTSALPQLHPHGEVSAQSKPAADAPNVLLITVDTLRADRLEPYGAKEIDTPAARRLAQEGTRWTNALASSPWTGPSFVSIHSGQYPSALRLGRVCTLYGTYPTLAETLARRGYRTEAVVNNPFLRAELAFDRGFQYFEHTDDPEWLMPIRGSVLHGALSLFLYNSTDTYRASVMSDRAISRLERLKGRKFFLWVHYMDPHIPYENREERVQDLDLGYVGPYDKMFWDYKGVRERRLQLSEADRNRIVNLYEQDVAYAERHIARVLEAVDKLGLADNTVVIYVADHGEELFDHGSIEHGHTLFRELLRVPLFIRWPGHLAAGRIDERPASLVDIFPTVCAMTGSTAAPHLPGVNLLAGSAPDRALYAENMLYGPQIRAMVREHVKLIEDPFGTPLFVFNLARDEGEQENLATADQELAAALHENFNQWKVAMMQLAETLVGDRMAATNLPDQIKQKLFSLGYTSPGQ